MKGQRIPTKITLDAYAASHRAVADLKDSGELPRRVRVRTSKYLNNVIEQDHRRVKQRLVPMLGLKSFRTAGDSDRRHRAGRQNQEGTIQSRQARRTDGKDAGDLASRPCRIIRITCQSANETDPIWSGLRICTRARNRDCLQADSSGWPLRAARRASDDRPVRHSALL